MTAFFRHARTPHASLAEAMGHPRLADLRSFAEVLRPGESFGPKLMSALTAHGLQPAHVAVLTGLFV